MWWRRICGLSATALTLLSCAPRAPLRGSGSGGEMSAPADDFSESRTDDADLLPYYRVTVVSGAIAARRPDGSAWHTSAPDGTWKVIGGLAGLAMGQLELGIAAGALFDGKAETFGPAPLVTLSLAGRTYETAALRPTLHPVWDEAIIIDASTSRPDDVVVVMVRDGIDQGVISQHQLTIAELVDRNGHTLPMGDVAALELRVEPAMPVAREHVVSVPSRGVHLEFDPGDIVQIGAQGEVCVRADRCFGPDGDFEHEVTGTFADFERPRPRSFRYNYREFEWNRHGQLVALFDDHPLTIGSSATLRIPRRGKLFLLVNDTDPDNNTGTFTVNIRVNPGLAP